MTATTMHVLGSTSWNGNSICSQPTSSSNWLQAPVKYNTSFIICSKVKSKPSLATQLNQLKGFQLEEDMDLITLIIMTPYMKFHD